jgi:hydrogenase-1 operon protein HyaF
MTVMNAPHILSEIQAALGRLAESGETRIFDLEHFPLTPGDARFLEEALGQGEVTVSSQSGDLTVWRESAIAGVWWGKYRQGSEKVTLRTIEVTDFPQLARAQKEDIEDGIAQLEERAAASLSNQQDGRPAHA